MVQKKNTVKGMGYFNLLRGIGILLIIWGHSASIFTAYQNENERLENGIYSVLGGGIMAMFFLISGYQFYKRSPQKCLHIQKRMLLYPYGITAVAVLLSKGILSVLKQRNFTEHGGEYLLTYLLGLNAEGGGLLWGIPIESVSILWFVLALFGGWMIYNGIMQCKSQWLRWSLISVCGVLAWLLGRVSRVWVFLFAAKLGRSILSCYRGGDSSTSAFGKNASMEGVCPDGNPIGNLCQDWQNRYGKLCVETGTD